MKIMFGMLLSLLTASALADTSHTNAGAAKSPPLAARSTEISPKTQPEQSIVLTLASLRHVVMTQCQAMIAERDAQQALTDAMRTPPKK